MCQSQYYANRPSEHFNGQWISQCRIGVDCVEDEGVIGASAAVDASKPISDLQYEPVDSSAAAAAAVAVAVDRAHAVSESILPVPVRPLEKLFRTRSTMVSSPPIFASALSLTNGHQWRGMGAFSS